MNPTLVNVVTRFHEDEAGQGLVEYVLIIALVAFSAVAGMSTLASYLNSAFTAVGSKMGNYIS
jgi:pilus assembly protein Flp/PilA